MDALDWALLGCAIALIGVIAWIVRRGGL